MLTKIFLPRTLLACILEKLSKRPICSSKKKQKKTWSTASKEEILQLSKCHRALFLTCRRNMYIFGNHFVANDPSWTCANPFTNILIGTGIILPFIYLQDIGETGLTMFSIEKIQFLKGRCLTEQLVSRAIHINDFYLHSFGDGFFSAL